MERIDALVDRIWNRLWAGEKVHVQVWAVEAPWSRPDLFTPITEAWPVGQTCDYVWRRRNGTRVHAHCCVRDGQRTVRFHVDKWDPEHDFFHLVAHGLFETPVGPVLGLVGLIGLVAVGAAVAKNS